MTNQEFRTLTYTTRPKTSKRTTFQDELKAAVSARSRKTDMGQISYSDDLSEAEDDFLLSLKLRQKKASAFQARNKRTNFTDDELLDEGQRGRMKKVSFLETYTIQPHLEDVKVSDSHGDDPLDLPVYQQKNFNLFSSQTSSHKEEADLTSVNDKSVSADPQTATLETSRSSLEVKEDPSLALPLDSSETEPPDPEEKLSSAGEESCQTPRLSAPDLRVLSLADSVNEKEPPKPKPRQRTFGKRVQSVEKMDDAASEDFSRAQSSSISIPLYTDTSSDTAWAEERMNSDSNSPSNNVEQSQLRDNLVSDNISNPDSKTAEAFKENHHSVGQLDQPSNTDAKTFDTRKLSFPSKTPQKSQRPFYKDVESKYLGTCKLLDRKVSLEGSQPQTVNALRAAVYQKWLQEKKGAMKETMLLRKQEEITENQKKKEEEDRKEAAAAAYEAWKKQKAQSLEVTARERKEKMRKEKRGINEKEERKQSAKQVYDKWKLENDQKLKAKLRKQREVETKCQLEKQENKEDRKRDSKYAFTSWSEKKKNVIHGKLATEHKIVKNKAEEERYIKEERDKMAIEAFENWLTRKDLEEKRQREEMRIQTILCESPPPPWNPPNKTVPFRK